ncbi:tripartite tricarboxylate transporter permease [Pelagibacterium flavum]|uniref:Tripartite tricarboxylate transporter permease n=1 Tax=Pelagibacterium flavum TaxID=2984530 RepID=A0ABY6IJE5_9HYPH|nr:tripartite tricarboxylate transporter permease [Pelagibacterium sp. YIM 151497]MAN77730.1 tricarboxylate transporter [Hyphomicrobiales bacterium]UYQ70601.1 tripartite tricarboxylate transporter permease [Pelagibacterium sp. YIM 151497]|tara:strand:+ start:1246 stop:3234 length:1989 start_codon:yes stop_codon:yes gene_type:complete
MLDVLFSALVELLTPHHMMFLTLGVLLGLVIGILPGLGGIVGLSLLLPFLYGMDQTSALAMLIGLVAIIPTSDTFASVLMGIPGSTASQATVLDGFPLAKKGQAARALSAAFSASLMGGLFGALILTGFVVIARPLILSFSSAELFALTLFGLSMVGVLSGNNLAKGVAAAALGLAFGAVGAAPATGEYRMDFGLLYLSTGIPLVIVALGLFAVPEIVDLLRGGSSIASKSSSLGHGWLQGLKDTWTYKWLALRCSGLGAIIGAIPGLGGSVVDWIAYGHVVQTSRDRSQYGKGDIRGVIAPESANNAKEGGGLIPTLLFGIPGSGSMAVFLAGLILLGIQPGPAMADRNLDVTYTIVWSLALANVIGTLLCIVAAPGIARLTTIRYTLIAPFMIMVITFASFQATRSLNDLVALLIVGAIGVLLKRFGWPRPGFLIGFVLATQAERYLYQAVQFSGWGFLTRPLVIGIIVLTVVSVWLGARTRPGEEAAKVSTEGSTELAQPGQAWPQILFGAAVLAGFVFVFWESFGLTQLGGIFPTWVAVVGVAATLVAMVPLVMGKLESTANFDTEVTPREHDVRGGAWAMLAWLALFVGLVAIAGYFAALLVFFVTFLRTMAKASWLKTILLTLAAAIFMMVLARSLNLVMPAGFLQGQFRLPWPFR